MSHIEVYGFGSFFSGSTDYGDIDILLIHENRSQESCSFAISCKRELQAKIKNIHVTMLSKQAEQSFSFRSTAQAKYLGLIDTTTSKQDIRRIVVSIQGQSAARRSNENENDY